MKIFKLVVTAAAVSLAVLAGCGDDNGAGSGGGGSGVNKCGVGGIIELCKTVTIGNQVWLAENLNKETEDSWCYGNSTANCAKYGRLYTWEAARKACQFTGWHLPNHTEWGTLAKAAGGTGDYGASGEAGTKLKSKKGWKGNGNGTDDFGFSALPGGVSFDYGDRDGFFNAGSYGYWWTATSTGTTFAYYRSMGYSYGSVDDDDGSKNHDSDKSNGYSVRCVKN
jgi:uncharacterized protein (TIGR02145 family)